MYQKFLLAVLCLTISCFVLTPAASAQNYGTQVSHNLLTGLTNTLTCWTPLYEVPADEIDAANTVSEAATNGLIGLTASPGCIVTKATIGVMQTAFFWVPGVSF